MKHGLLSKQTQGAEAFFENVDDIINEEDIEESVINQSIRKLGPNDLSMSFNQDIVQS